jgi:septum formation protein
MPAGVGRDYPPDRAVALPSRPGCLILASASPRRLALLRQIGFSPAAVVAPVIDEQPARGELPRALALRLARAKALSVAGCHPDAIVLAADTVVARGRRILPKPACQAEARRCLALLSGARHRVFGGIAVAAPGGRVTMRLVATAVAFKRLGADEIEAYLGSGEWRDKAGGYAIQGRAAAFCRGIVGSYSNVVGLSLFETANLLTGHGLRADTGAPSGDVP